MEILKCFTSTHHGILIGDNLGEQLTEERKKLHQLLQFPEEDQKYLPVWTNKTYLLGNVNRVGVNHETHHVLEQICKHMHIPEIKSISRRSRLHTEASKELKLGLSSFARFFSLHALPLCYSWYSPSFSMHLGDSYMENKVLLTMSTCAAQPAFPSKCWGMVTKNTTLETLPCTKLWSSKLFLHQLWGCNPYPCLYIFQLKGEKWGVFLWHVWYSAQILSHTACAQNFVKLFTECALPRSETLVLFSIQ